MTRQTTILAALVVAAVGWFGWYCHSLGYYHGMRDGLREAWEITAAARPPAPSQKPAQEPRP